MRKSYSRLRLSVNRRTGLRVLKVHCVFKFISATYINLFSPISSRMFPLLRCVYGSQARMAARSAAASQRWFSLSPAALDKIIYTECTVCNVFNVHHSVHPRSQQKEIQHVTLWKQLPKSPSNMVGIFLPLFVLRLFFIWLT